MVSVRWSEDAWYTGVVQSFDADSGKHRVAYDEDSDARLYDMRTTMYVISAHSLLPTPLFCDVVWCALAVTGSFHIMGHQ